MDARIFLADLQSGESKAISADAPIPAIEVTTDARISGDIVAWTDTPGEPFGAAEPWSLMVYDITTASRRTVLTSRKNLTVQAIVGQDAVAYTQYQVYPDKGVDLYLVDIK